MTEAAGLALLLASGFGLAAAAAAVHTAHVLTRPPRRTFSWAVSRSLPASPAELRSPDRPDGYRFETWTFRSRGIDLPVWDIRGDDPGGPTIIFTHGWGDSRITALPRVPHLGPLCSRLLLWDLPGHGDARGRCTLGVRETDDLLALIDHVAGADASALVLHGFSLGAGVSIDAAVRAQRGRIAAVIAEAPYRIPMTPARNVLAGAGLPWRLTLPPAMAWAGLRNGHGLSWATERMGTRFDRARLAADLRFPLLVLAGDADAVSPLDDARAIAAAAPRGTLAVIPGAGHLNLWTDPAHAERSAAAVRDFLAASLTSSPSPAGR
jgi:pimeloyl-ACP methyl ester carboxylesterase